MDFDNDKEVRIINDDDDDEQRFNNNLFNLGGRDNRASTKLVRMADDDRSNSIASYSSQFTQI